MIRRVHVLEQRWCGVDKQGGWRPVAAFCDGAKAEEALRERAREPGDAIENRLVTGFLGVAGVAGQPIDRGPEPASPLPWTAGSPWEVYPSEGINNVTCDNGCDGGCDNDEGAPVARCRQLDHADSVVCDTYGLEDFAKRDAGAIAHRVNTHDAICDRAEAAEAELAALASAVRAEQQRAERAERDAKAYAQRNESNRGLRKDTQRRLSEALRRAESAERERDALRESLREIGERCASNESAVASCLAISQLVVAAIGDQT